MKKKNNPGIQIQSLPSGATLVYEPMPHVRSAAIGFWIDFGSRRESPRDYGSAHFIEHMLFKGAAGRSALDIALFLENVGGALNAMTGKETTCFYAKTLSEHAPMAFDILSDLFFLASFNRKEFDREKEVVLEEIRSHMDDPEDLVYDRFMEGVYTRDGIGHPILGYPETVGALKRDRLFKTYSDVYRPDRLIVSVAGALEEADLAGLAGKAASKWKGRRSAARAKKSVEPGYAPQIGFHRKDIEQAHFCLGFKGISHRHDDRYVYSAIDILLSGGMSSRLFQEVREKRGLVYDIRTENSNFTDAGVFDVSASCRTESLLEVLEATRDELAALKKGETDEGELDRVKSQLKAGVVMSAESVTGRMMKNARCLLYYGRALTDEEVIAEVEGITRDDVTRVAGELFRQETLSVCVLGPAARKTEKDVRRLLSAYL